MTNSWKCCCKSRVEIDVSALSRLEYFFWRSMFKKRAPDLFLYCFRRFLDLSMQRLLSDSLRRNNALYLKYATVGKYNTLLRK